MPGHGVGGRRLGTWAIKAIDHTWPPVDVKLRLPIGSDDHGATQLAAVIRPCTEDRIAVLRDDVAMPGPEIGAGRHGTANGQGDLPGVVDHNPDWRAFRDVASGVIDHRVGRTDVDPMWQQLLAGCLGHRCAWRQLPTKK